MHEKALPRITVTMGYPAGIGPELVIKTLSQQRFRHLCRIMIVGDLRILQKAAKIYSTSVNRNTIKNVKQAEYKPAEPDLIDLQNVPVGDFRWGEIVPSLGKASGEYLEVAWKAATEGKTDGIVSGVLNKEALNKGGYTCRDELELISRITQSRESFTVGVTGNLWTIPVTTHIPFKEIHEKITKDRVLNHIKVMDELMRRYGFSQPRIGVAALNVHGGEDRLFGGEEAEAISPAILEARRIGIDASGPFPADTIFVRALREEFDCIVGMYHDQINIARKLIAGMKSVTLFMGLPVPCGTPAHGTALDIAGRGTADSSGMETAIEAVSKLARFKQ